jgi:tryptophan-rich sensory protein
MITQPITLRQILFAIVAFVVINLIAGYGIVLLGADIPQIYATLNKPSFAPPTWVFGVVWTFNNSMVIYGILRTINLPKSILRTNLLGIDTLIAVNYMVFQYLSFGSGILFGRIIPAMFFVPTLSMLILTVMAMIKAYQLDTQSMSLKNKILSGQSIFASYWSLFGWLLIASALGFGIWIMN